MIMMFRGRRLPRWRQLVLLAVVAATVIAAFMSSNFAQDAKDRLDRVTTAQKALDQDQASFAVQVTCTQRVLRDTLEALKARSVFAETSAQIELVLLEAQKAFLGTVPANDEERAQAFKDYTDALNASIIAINDQLRVRENNPFPTRGEILACIAPPSG